jgi:hypothetical protein
MTFNRHNWMRLNLWLKLIPKLGHADSRQAPGAGMFRANRDCSRKTGNTALVTVKGNRLRQSHKTQNRNHSTGLISNQGLNKAEVLPDGKHQTRQPSAHRRNHSSRQHGVPQSLRPVIFARIGNNSREKYLRLVEKFRFGWQSVKQSYSASTAIR